jgi:ribulose-5-phosphate 4-epimerase/fuculose-1-phosphate aldolase
MVVDLQIKASFQTFFLSKEIVKCPLILDIARISKKIKKLGLEIEKNTIISISYGKRLLITNEDVNLENISNQDLIEIVDFDPIKNIVMAIGLHNPNIETPVHWMIHHARDDVNVIIQLNGEKAIKYFTNKIPITDNECPSGSLEHSMEILKTLKQYKKIIIKNMGCMFVGIDLREVEDLIFKGDR